jgi:hypothetical protein
MADNQQVTSFVVRFSPMGQEDIQESKRWRIRVTHVQGQEETTIASMEELCEYMEQILKRG